MSERPPEPAAGQNSAAVLADLAQEINAHDKSRRACEVKGLMHGLRIGQLLIEAKKVVPHGAFLDWLKSSTSVSPRMCQIYMTVARDPRLVWAVESEYETVSHLTLTSAVKLARDHKAIEQWAKEISAKWAAAAETRRKWVKCVAEIRESFKENGGDETFTAWLAPNANIGRVFAEKIPGLLDAGDYDDAAWTAAMFDDIAAEVEAAGEGEP